MATVTQNGFLHLNEKIKKEIQVEAAQQNTVSALGVQAPIDLTTESVLSFTNYTGAQAVSEGEAKVETPFESKVTKVQRGMVQSQVRISNQALRKAADNGVGILEAAQKVIAGGLGKDLDIIMVHNTSPNDGSATVDFTVGLATGSDTLVHEIDEDDRPDAALRAAIVELGGNEKEISGIAVTPEFFYKLAYLGDNNGRLLYPQLTMADRSNLLFDGVRLAVSTAIGTKKHNKSTASASGVEFIVGDFSKVRYGTDIEQLEMITMGDPDNVGRDLKGHNEVMLRLEALVEYVITDKNAFVVGKKAE